MGPMCGRGEDAEKRAPEMPVNPLAVMACRIQSMCLVLGPEPCAERHSQGRPGMSLGRDALYCEIR